MEARRLVILVGIFAACLIIPWLAKRDFSTRGEPREALVIQDMVETGNWVLPAGYGGVVPSKPPLMHWAAGAISLVVGKVTELTARWPSALAAILILCVFCAFLVPRFGQREALVSSLILLTSVEWFRAGLDARVDMTLAALLGIGLIVLYRWFDEHKCQGVSWLAVSLFGAAALTKGPVAIVLPAAIFFGFLALREASFKGALWSTFKVFIPAFLLMAVWYVLAYRQSPDAFSQKVYYENVARFLGTQEDEPHKHSAVFLFGTVVWGMLPWSLLAAPAALIALWHHKRLRLRGIWEWCRSTNALNLYALLIVLGFMAFYSIPAGKRSVYLLPVYPIFSVWIATLLLQGRPAEKRLSTAVLKIAAILVMFLYGVVLLAGAGRIDLGRFGFRGETLEQAQYYLEQLKFMLQQAALWEIIILLLPLGICLSVVLRPGSKEADDGYLGAASAMCLSLLLAGHAVVYPAIANSLSPKNFAQALLPLVEGRDDLYSFGNEFYGLSFYLGKRVYRYEDKQPRRGLLLITERNLTKFENKLGSQGLVQAIMISPSGIVKPTDKVVLAQFERMFLGLEPEGEDQNQPEAQGE